MGCPFQISSTPDPVSCTKDADQDSIEQPDDKVFASDRKVRGMGVLQPLCI